MDIVIDFDGTCVTHEFPLVGKDIRATSEEEFFEDILNANHIQILGELPTHGRADGMGFMGKRSN